MLLSLSRRILNGPHLNTLRPFSSNKTCDITDPVFWEDESRPIPNVRDNAVHLATSKNQHLRWERTLEKLCLIGEVYEGARRFRIGHGFGTQFGLRTRTVIKDSSGVYKEYDQFHQCIVLAELLQKMALEQIRTGVGVKVEGQLYYYSSGRPDSFFSIIQPTVIMETFEKLDWNRSIQKISGKIVDRDVYL